MYGDLKEVGFHSGAFIYAWNLSAFVKKTALQVEEWKQLKQWRLTVAISKSLATERDSGTRL